jgi:hypothetical protein
MPEGARRHTSACAAGVAREQGMVISVNDAEIINVL